MDVTAARGGARRLGSAYVALAALMWSLAGILQRQLQMSLASQLAGRAIFAFLALLVFIAVAERGQVIRAFHAIGRPGLVVAVLIAISSGAFITALNDTSVANVLIVQALVPLVAALAGRLAGEPVHARTWAAIGVAVVGFAVMAGAPGRPGPSGLVYSVIATLAFSAMIVVARSKADVSMAPATCLSQVLVFAVFAPFAHAGELIGTNLGYVALLGIVQMGLGLFFLSLGARLIPAANVALITQLENVLGPLWVWLAGIEHPSAPTLAGGVVVIAAVAMEVTRGPGSARGLQRQPDAVQLRFVTVGAVRQDFHQRVERGGPAFPVRAAGFVRNGLDELAPEGFPVAAERVIDDRGRQREHCALPGSVEGQFPVPPGQIHFRQAQLCSHRRATPIIESRVTSPARSASVIRPVPGGRWGKTR